MGEPEQIGVIGVDYLENFSMSTPALLFTLIHWELSLGTNKGKASAGALFDDLTHHVIGRNDYIMLLDDDLPCGCLATSGVQLNIKHCTIKDCTALSNHFTLMQSALNRTQCSKFDLCNR